MNGTFVYLCTEMYRILPYKLSTQNCQKFPPLKPLGQRRSSGFTYFSKWKNWAKPYFQIFPVRICKKSWHSFCIAVELVFCTWKTYFQIFPTFADSADWTASRVYFQKIFSQKTVYLYKKTPKNTVIRPNPVIFSF